MHGNIYRQVTRHNILMQCGKPGNPSVYLCLIEVWDVRHCFTDIELAFLEHSRGIATELI